MRCNKFKQKYVLFDRAQEIYWRKEMITDNYKFQLKYTIQQHFETKECFFQEITPTRLGFNSIDCLLKHYIITYHPLTREVTNVRNRKMGDVQFRGIRVDNDAGHVSHTVVKLWTHHDRRVFNIVHMHLNDTSE